MVEAEAAWVRGFLDELRKGTLPGIKEWKAFHDS